MKKDHLPDIAEFDIPSSIRAAGAGWSPFMVEMADHIGAYPVLLICSRLAGRDLYVPINADCGPFRDFLPADVCRTIAAIFGGERIFVPTAKAAIAIAKRASIISAVRAGHLSVTDAAIICRSTRSYMSRLVNESDEGFGVEPARLPEPLKLRILRRAADVVVGELGAAKVDPTIVANISASLMALASDDLKASPMAIGPILSSSLSTGADHVR